MSGIEDVFDQDPRENYRQPVAARPLHEGEPVTGPTPVAAASFVAEDGSDGLPSPTRYVRRPMAEGGGMVEDPEGQWVHVESLGIADWKLDPADRAAAPAEAREEGPTDG